MLAPINRLLEGPGKRCRVRTGGESHAIECLPRSLDQFTKALSLERKARSPPTGGISTERKLTGPEFDIARPASRFSEARRRPGYRNACSGS